MEWLAQFFDTILSVFPRLLVVRTTHRAIKWRLGSEVVELEPGLHWYWPIVTELDTVVVARRPLNLPSQVLMTKDKQPVAIGGFVVFRINDVVKAFGEKNWDVEQTVREISTAAIVEIVMQNDLDALLSGIAAGPGSELMTSLTKNCKGAVQQYGVAVQRCGLTDFCVCQTFKLLGDGASRILPTEED